MCIHLNFCHTDMTGVKFMISLLNDYAQIINEWLNVSSIFCGKNFFFAIELSTWMRRLKEYSY